MSLLALVWYLLVVFCVGLLEEFVFAPLRLSFKKPVLTG